MRLRTCAATWRAPASAATASTSPGTPAARGPRSSRHRASRGSRASTGSRTAARAAPARGCAATTSMRAGRPASPPPRPRRRAWTCSPERETTMTSSVSGTGSAATSTATASVSREDQMDQDTFLKLLVAQMKYQDPSNPTDPTQFMSQTAQFTQVQKLEQIATQNASLLGLQRSMSGGALAGPSVTYTDDAGQSRTGTVSSVVLGDDTTDATAVVNGSSVPMGRITSVS